MIKKISLFTLSIFALTLAVQGSAKKVTFLRSIDFHRRDSGKSPQNFFLGAQQTSPIHPTFICRIAQDLYCITDAVNGSVHVLDAQGRIVKNIPRAGRIRLHSPVSACVDDENYLYVADSGNHAVFQFDREFAFKKIFTAPDQSRITGMVFSHGFFYCIDTQNHRVLCIDRNGGPVQVIGRRGNKQGEFNFPTHIATDGEFLYITDALNFRVQIFDMKGHFVHVFGTNGRGGGNFSKPKGIAVDSQRRIYVADVSFDNVQLFDFNGEFQTFFGGPGQEEGKFWMPSGVMIDKDDAIWVADTFNNRIQVFKVVEASR